MKSVRIGLRSQLMLLAVACSASAAPGVRLYSSVSSPQPVGTSIGLTPRVENVGKGMLVFRYAVSVDGGDFRIIRDFSQQRDFVWSPALSEHQARVRLTVRNNETKETAQDEIPFRTVSRTKGSAPVVTPTAHPLIALFSGPPCAAGTQFRVAFRPENEETASRTPLQPCRGSLSNNVLVAGMRVDTEYRLRQELVTGKEVKPGAWIPFHTGMLDGDFSPVSIAVPRAPGSTASEPVLVFSAASVASGRRPFATDLNGRVIWYMRSAEFLTRTTPGGRFLMLVEGRNAAN